MKKKALKDRIFNMVPPYALILLIAIFTVNCAVYYGARLLTEGKKHYFIELPFEEKIPFWTWSIIIYFGCYVFWIVNYILSTRNGLGNAIRFAIAEMMGKITCCIVYVLYPTTMIRPEVTGNSIWDQIVKWLYQVDAPNNLFPSIHCYVSWFCFIGIRSQKNISKGYKIFSLIFALAVCVSTLTIKQHVFIDTFSGIILAEVCYFLAKYICKPFQKKERK